MGVKDEYMRMGEEAVAEAAASSVSGEIAATSALPPVVPAIVYRDKLPKMPEVIIEGILLEGHKMLLTGPSKANKTWCLINLAVSVATGGYWIDFACAKRKVLFIDLETDARTLQRRISRVAEAKGADPAVVAANLFVWPLRGKSCGLAQIVDELFARFEELFGDSKKDEVPSPQELRSLLDGLSEERDSLTRQIAELKAAAAGYRQQFEQLLQAQQEALEKASELF